MRIHHTIVAGIAGAVLLSVPGMALAQAGTAPADVAAPTTGQPATGATAPVGADGKIALAPGVEVFDTQGGKVGTLTKVEGANVVLKTTKSEVMIPASSLARTEKHALIAMTAAQIDAAAAAQSGAAAGAPTGGQAAADPAGAEAGATTQAGDAGASHPAN